MIDLSVSGDLHVDGWTSKHFLSAWAVLGPR